MNPAKTTPEERIPPFTQLTVAIGTDADTRRERWALLSRALEMAEEPITDEKLERQAQLIQGHVVIAAENLKRALAIAGDFVTKTNRKAAQEGGMGRCS